MKNIIILIVVLGVLALLACKKAGPSINISPNSFLVDVRTAEEFKQGSVPNAVNIPLDQVEARLSEFDNKDDIIVFCRSGNRSGQAKTILEKNGHKNVQNGGAWQNVNKQLSK